jgi:hypothetical protein
MIAANTEHRTTFYNDTSFVLCHRNGTDGDAGLDFDESNIPLVSIERHHLAGYGSMNPLLVDQLHLDAGFHSHIAKKVTTGDNQCVWAMSVNNRTSAIRVSALFDHLDPHGCLHGELFGPKSQVCIFAAT